MKQRVTIDDVAKAAGVSKQTVSRAINDKGEISPGTKSHVLEVVSRLGYRPSRLAQAMNTQRSYMVGFVVPDITNPFFPEVIRGVQDSAVAAGYNVMLCNTDSNPQTELAVMDMLSTQGVDGIIAFGFNGPPEEMSRFADTFRPIVFINSPYDHQNIDLIMVRNDLGARMAIDHFVRIGHRCIGMLTNGSVPATADSRREQGFKAALLDHRLPLTDAHIVRTAPHLSGGYEGTVQLLKNLPDVSAIFAYNDLMGLGAIRACLDMGKRVPEEISIIGFDDIQLSQMTSPSLSSIRLDKHHLGYLAMKRVLDLIENPLKQLPDIEIGLQLIHRESTKQTSIENED